MDRRAYLSYDVKMQITRRKLALAAIGSAGLTQAVDAQAPAPSEPEDVNTEAKEQIRQHAEALAKVELVMATEPAFQFKA